jgi:glycosyltransferase involved in cell wall biosynthesis
MGHGAAPLRVMRVVARMNVGGPALQSVTLLRGLPPDRFEQRLYTGFVEPDEADYVDLRAAGLTVHRVPTLGRRIRPADDMRALASLTAEMRRFRPHIVHTHTFKAGALGRVAAALAHVPGRVHSFHGHLLKGYFPPHTVRLISMTESILARHTDHLIAVGERVRDDLLAAGIGRAGQYTVVPPGTSLEPLPPSQAAREQLGLAEGDKVVACVGRLTRIKRPDRLVAVAREVIAAIPGVTFAICGDGELGAELSSAAQALGRSMRLLGWRADVETVYAAADVILLTSDNEGMPVSLIEAGLAGVPAVATNVGSVAEVVKDGSTGLLTRCDADDLAQSVIRLLRDDRLRRQMGAAATSWTHERFGAERLVADVERVYEAIALDRGWWPDFSDMERIRHPHNAREVAP